MPRYVPFAILLFLGALGCRQATPRDLAGKWVMTDDRKFLPLEVRKVVGTIVLNANGTFSASELPLFFGDPKESPPGATSGTGEWKLAEKDGELGILLAFRTLSGQQPTYLPPGVALNEDTLRKSPYGAWLNIRRAWFVGPRFILFYIAGDASETVIEFEKK